MHRTGDLSLRDTSNFVLWEFLVRRPHTARAIRLLTTFQEEHPPIISNFGMGSILVNYYRKKNEKDDHVPKVRFYIRVYHTVTQIVQYDLGEPIIIEPQDESPFMKFGYVYPGQTVPSLYNNLIRAPLFRHKPYPTDFLVIKCDFLHISVSSGVNVCAGVLRRTRQSTSFVKSKTFSLSARPTPSRKYQDLTQGR